MKNVKFILALFGLILSTSVFTKTPSATIKKKLNTCVLEDVATAGLGDVKYSILSEAQFQNVNGAGWILMKGQSKTSLGISTETSVFSYLTASNHSLDFLPDGRGLFLRGKNNGRSDGVQDPGGERLLGDYQVDELKSHTHTYTMLTTPGGGGMTSPYPAAGAVQTTAAAVNYTGGTETRSKNIDVNIFVKIKRNCLDAAAMALTAANTASIIAIQNYNLQNTCDTCLNLPESNLADLQAKAACFKNEVDLYEASQKQWSVSCTARTVGYAKKVLMLIGASRDEDDNIWLTHLDNQYPYYNAISVN
jgi:hypothetical protein